MKEQAAKRRQAESVEDSMFEYSLNISDITLPEAKKKKTRSKDKSAVKHDALELHKIKKESKDYHITNSWHNDALGPLNFEEKARLRSLQHQEKERLKKVAESRHTYDASRR